MFLLLPAALAEPEPSEQVVVEQRSAPASAAQRDLDASDVVAMPGRSTDDLLRATRGLHQSAHSGHGKAFQYFLRGFDAVHGADIAVSLEGVPLNEPSNVHGHGYLDLHFIPRQLVTGAVFRPGIARAEVGDFGVAGSGDLSLGMAQEGLQVQVGGGTDRSGSIAMGFRPEGRGAGSFAWLDAEEGLGVGPSRHWRQVRAGVGLDGTLGGTDLRAFLLAYRGDFESPGVVREDDYASGAMGFYDAYPSSGSGRSARALGAVSARTRLPSWRTDTTLWAGWRALELRQSFTGFYEHPDTGDATLQTQDGLSAGLSSKVERAFGDALALAGGFDARLDLLGQQEAGIDVDGAVWDPRIDTRIAERSVGAWVAAPTRPLDWLSAEAGVRVQHFTIGLDRTLDSGLGVGKAQANAPVLAPRGIVRLFEDGPLTVFGSAGRGFRSPEARGVENGRAPVSISDGGELSAVLHAVDALQVRGGAFGTWISNEIVFDHAAARFLTTGRTRRLGAYGGLTLHPIDAVSIDLDVTGTDGRYTASREPIPYAPRVLAVGQLTTKALVTGPLVWTAGVRSWWLGQRPLPGGFASHAAFVTDVTARATHRAWTFDLDVDNVFANRWRDGEFFYASHWDPGAPVSALPRRHFTAGAPFAVRLGIGWRLR
ncbi:MAG: TonB-dependent receptor plug domain-containing protein [Alphaproteobacteria bacterium]|nr:TonB-dependent receptor plug domain-containing protein [Alphaproteobacteria bacterium]